MSFLVFLMALSLIPISVDSQSVLCFFQSGWGYTQQGSLGSPSKLSICVDLQGCSPPLQIYILAQKSPSPQLCHVFPAWGPPIPLNLLRSLLHIIFHTLSVSLTNLFHHRFRKNDASLNRLVVLGGPGDGCDYTLGRGCAGG